MKKDLIFRLQSKKILTKKDLESTDLTNHFVLLDGESSDRFFTRIGIWEDDFLFLALAYGLVIDNKGLDEYKCYCLNKQDWLKLLNEALKLVQFKTFQEMYDYVKSAKIGIHYEFSWMLDKDSEMVWNEKEEIKLMIEDLQKWTTNVIKEEIEIWGL